MREQGDGLLIERDKSVAAQPGALVRNQAIRKIPSCFEHRQASIYSSTIERDVLRIEQSFQGSNDIVLSKLVNAAQNPDELA
jgi:hypothetical protein